jgi:outer membrane immunogenic protein
MALAAGPVFAGGPTEPVPDAPVVVAPATPVYNWTGFFAGGQIGYIGAGNNFQLDGNVLSPDASGFDGGIYGGYNWQGAGQTVFGFDAEYNWADADGSDNLVPGGGAESSTFTTSVDSTAALRGRVGYAMDRSLIYATAGIAWIDYSISESVSGDVVGTGDYSENGWTLGGGIEQAFANGWSGRIDYRYSDFGTIDEDAAQWDLTTSEIRVGFAKKF